MIIRTVVVVIMALVVAGIFSPSTRALSLKLSPLEYRTTLEKGEKKKGFIDVSNPNLESLTIRTKVQAFKQVDDTGTLQFFDDERVSAGVKLDFDEFVLKARQAMRIYFLIDGTKLAKGDVYAAIFFTSSDALGKASVSQEVRLGTLLSIVNETPGARQARVERLETAWFHFDTHIRGTLAIQNTSSGATTGFYPKVSVSVWPFGQEKSVTSKLVFSGRTRETDFDVTTPPFGVYRIRAAYAGSSKERWVIVAHPLSIIAIATLAGGVFAWSRYRRKKSY